MRRVGASPAARTACAQRQFVGFRLGAQSCHVAREPAWESGSGIIAPMTTANSAQPLPERRPDRHAPRLRLAFGIATTSFAAFIDAVLLFQGHATQALGGLALVLLFVVVTVYDVSRFVAKAGAVEVSAETRPREAQEATAALQAIVTSTTLEPSREVRDLAPPMETRGGAAGDRAAAAGARARAMGGSTGLTREQVEQIMRAAAHWGWTQARAGLFSEEPVPYIEWERDGKPKILFGRAGVGGIVLRQDSKLGAP